MSDIYDDIIDLPHHVSKSRRHMSLHDRAAQFAPFAALSGYGADISEAARLTDKKAALDECELALLDCKLNILQSTDEEQADLTVTYFIPDDKKAGGEYVSKKGSITSIDEYERIIIMSDGTRISIDDILDIDGKIFEQYLN